MLIKQSKHILISLAVGGSLLLGACSPEQSAGNNSQQVAMAKQPTLSLEEVFSGNFNGERFGPVRWLADGSGYTTLEAGRGGEGNSIVRHNPVNGETEVLIAASQLIPDGLEKALEVHDYSWSEDGSKALIYTNSKRVWRRNTQGDYWVLDIGSGALKQIGQGFPESSLMFAKFNTDASKIAYVQKTGKKIHDIYVEDIETGEKTRLTMDGSETIINGTFDWVYEEEFGLRDGFRWSPDGTKIAYWQSNTEGAKNFKIINNTDTLYPVVNEFPYPKVGEQNAAVKVGVVAATGGETTWMDVPGDMRNNYIAYMDWAANSDELVIQQLNRRQNTNNLMLANVENGSVSNVLTDKDDAWLDPVDDFRWFNDGAEFMWVSEDSGWRHIYRISRDGKTVTDLTPGDYDVVSIRNIDVAGGYLYFMASPEDPQRLYLYRVPLDGSGTLEKLTPDAQTGTHSYQISADAKWAIHRYSHRNMPEVIDLVTLPDHQSVRTFVDNAALKAKFDAIDKGKLEFFDVTVNDGVTLEGLIRYPSDFDATKKYPVIFYVYGEPAGMTAADRWTSGDLWHFNMIQRGYIYITLDNRGQPAPKGRDWRKSIYRQLGFINTRDQMWAAKKLLAERPYLDAERVGVWGHSGGGTSTLNLLFRYPDTYHVGVANAPVPDLKLYDTIYQERYSGILPDDHDYYISSSAITHAAGLKGDLLLVHGTGDDNVHYQGSERLINELVRLNKPFDFMSYPNRTHGIREGKNTVLHRFTKQANYFVEHLTPGAKPQ